MDFVRHVRRRKKGGDRRHQQRGILGSKRRWGFARFAGMRRSRGDAGIVTGYYPPPRWTMDSEDPGLGRSTMDSVALPGSRACATGLPDYLAASVGGARAALRAPRGGGAADTVHGAVQRRRSSGAAASRVSVRVMSRSRSRDCSQSQGPSQSQSRRQSQSHSRQSRS